MSLDTLNEDEWKTVRRGKEEIGYAWVNHIRYFAVRNGEVEFPGTLEVSQDIMKIRELEGNKRLLEWGKDEL